MYLSYTMKYFIFVFNYFKQNLLIAKLSLAPSAAPSKHYILLRLFTLH